MRYRKVRRYPGSTIGIASVFLLMSTVGWADTLAYGQGLLWKIERENLRASYVFGTIHSADPRVLALAPLVLRSFDAAESFSGEVLLDPATVATLSRAMLYDDGTTLPALLPADLWEATRKAMAKRGVGSSTLVKTKPWSIILTLSIPSAQSGLTLDAALYQRAARQNKRLFGLETASEQIAVLDELPLENQIALLKEAVAQEPILEDILERLHGAYLQQDLAEIARLSLQPTSPADEVLKGQLIKRILDHRNVRMVQRMEPRLREGNAFIAVGALHLPGSLGILRLLEQRGYSVTAVH